MDVAQITPRYAVAPQIDPADAATIRAAGFTDVICNRPDAEVGPDLAADAVEAALTAQGVRFHRNPVNTATLGPAQVERQAALLAAAAGPVLAYCRSGTRSTIVWALGERAMTEAEILAAAAGAGYDLSPYRGAIGQR